MNPDQQPGHRSNLARNIVLAILCLCATAEFTLRGPVRFADANSFNDFISPYIQTRLWIHGEDPYSAQNLVRAWPPEAERFDFLSRDLADGTLVYKRGIPTAYPLTAFALLAPIAILPWHIAHLLWLVITVLSFAVTVISLLSVAKLLPWSHTSLLFLTLALALAPFHTALAAGSIVTVAVAASASAVWATTRQYEILAGLLLALAVSLKPQIGLPFCFYYLVRRRWRIPAVAVAAVALFFTLALLRCAISHTPWLQNYLYDARVLLGPGSLGDFTEADPLRFGLLNLHVAAYAILHNRQAATITATIVAAVAGIIWLFLMLRKSSLDEAAGLLALSTLVTLSLLPVYHRFYDGTLLIFPVAWALIAWNGPTRITARAVLIVIVLVFFVPGGTLLTQFQQAGHFASLRNYWWWNAFILSHESWSVLFLSLLLLRAMQIAQRASSKSA
jgi:hypothetical protein